MVEPTITYVLDFGKKLCGYLDRLQDSVIRMVLRRLGMIMLHFNVYQDVLLYSITHSIHSLLKRNEQLNFLLLC